ncbi:MAG: hypothetical protein ACR5K6_00590 [Wolbachia sp.]
MDLRKEEAILAYRLDTAKEEGREEEKKEGKEEREIEIAKAMLAEGMNAATIAKLTGLSTDEVEKLRFTYDQDKKREDDLS